MSRGDDARGDAARRPSGPEPGSTDSSEAPKSPEAPDGELERLRRRILEVDEELVRLVGERRDLVLEIGRVKGERGLPVLDPAREAEVVRRAAALAREEGVDEELVRDVVWRIVASARQAQEGRTTWGPPDSPRPDDGAGDGT